MSEQAKHLRQQLHQLRLLLNYGISCENYNTFTDPRRERLYIAKNGSVYLFSVDDKAVRYNDHQTNLPEFAIIEKFAKRIKRHFIVTPGLHRDQNSSRFARNTRREGSLNWQVQALPEYAIHKRKPILPAPVPEELQNNYVFAVEFINTPSGTAVHWGRPAASIELRPSPNAQATLAQMNTAQSPAMALSSEDMERFWDIGSV